MNTAVLILLLSFRVEARFITWKRAEVSKRKYLSKANGIIHQKNYLLISPKLNSQTLPVSLFITHGTFWGRFCDQREMSLLVCIFEHENNSFVYEIFISLKQEYSTDLTGADLTFLGLECCIRIQYTAVPGYPGTVVLNLVDALVYFLSWKFVCACAMAYVYSCRSTSYIY